MWARCARSSSAAQTSSRWRTLSTGGRLYTGLHTSARYIIITQPQCALMCLLLPLKMLSYSRCYSNRIRSRSLIHANVIVVLDLTCADDLVEKAHSFSACREPDLSFSFVFPFYDCVVIVKGLSSDYKPLVNIKEVYINLQGSVIFYPYPSPFRSFSYFEDVEMKCICY